MRALVVEECEQAGEVLGFPPAVRFSGRVDTLVGGEVAGQLLAVLTWKVLTGLGAAVAASGNETTGGDGRGEGP